MGKTIFECTAKAVKDNGKKIKCTVKLCSDSLTLHGNFGSTFSNGIQFNNLRTLTSRLGKEKLGLSKKNCVYFEYNSGKNVIKVFVKKLKDAEEFTKKFEDSKSVLIAKDEATYQDAIKQMEKNSITGFESAIKILNTIKYHSDSNAKIKHCEDRVAEIKDAQEKQRKNDIYYRAVTLMQNNKKTDYQSAIKLLETIVDWRDSKDQINTCRTKIAEIDKNDALYQDAKNLMKKDKISELENAVSIFKSILSWKDSNQLKEKCETRINDLIYAEAVRLMKSAESISNAEQKVKTNESAISLFEKISEWKDSKKLIYDCKEAIKRAIEEENKRKDKIYFESIALIKVDTIESYAEAEKKLIGIKEWKDASEKIKICRNRIAEIKKKLEEERKEKVYQEALIYKSKNTKSDFQIAVNKLQSIKDWKDSAQLLQECKKEIEKIEKAEELQRKEDEKQALINSESNVEEIEKNKKIIKDGSVKIYEPFLANPYYILGVSCKSTKAEALSVQDKIEKFAKLGKADLYKSKYDLRDIEKPNRDLSNIQSATMEISNINHKWFWFISSDYCKLWKLSYLFEELSNCDAEDNNYYDLLLACYFRLVMKNPDLSNMADWELFLVHLNKMLTTLEKNEERSVLTGRFNDIELSKYSSSEIVESFKNNIFAPIIEIISLVDIPQLKEALQCLKRKRLGKLKTIKTSISERLFVCFKEKIKDIDDVVESVANRESPTKQELKKISDKLAEFKRYKEVEFDGIEEILDKAYIDRIYNQFRQSIWEAMAIFENGKQLDDVLQYGKMIYEYCNAEDKQILRNVFGYQKLGLSETELTPTEMNTIAIKCDDKGEISKSIEWFKKAANAGDPDAQSNLAFRYYEGKKISKDVSTAIYWWKESAKSGNVIAEYMLSQVYSAEGRYQDIDEAMRWLRKACDKNFEPAMNIFNNLINMAKNGNYQERDFAIRMLRKMGLNV